MLTNNLGVKILLFPPLQSQPSWQHNQVATNTVNRRVEEGEVDGKEGHREREGVSYQRSDWVSASAGA